MTPPRKPRRFFWLEGVTRHEVERSLHDTSPTRLRQQGPRRVLVLVAALVMAALALSIFITHNKVGTYTEFGLMFISLLLYFQLRKAVRHVSDAPNELLDERQIAMRDAGHTVAYRLLSVLCVVYVLLILLVGPEGRLHPHVRDGFWVPMAWSYMMCCASLPAMVLAWRMPSEPEDEAPGDSAGSPPGGPP